MLPFTQMHECHLDLSFTSFDAATELVVLPPELARELAGDLAVLMVGVAQRQAASPTAMVQARLSAAADPLLFRPLHGAFNGPMAAVALHWHKE